MNPDNPRSSITVEQLDQQILDYDAMLAEKEAQEAVLSEINKRIGAQEGKLVGYLEDLGRDKYVHPKLTIGISNKWRVSLPPTDLDKAQFFDWLRAHGIFDRYAVVNSASLNSLYMAEWEAAKKASPEDAMTFSLPGIPAPTLFKALTKRKGKG